MTRTPGLRGLLPAVDRGLPFLHELKTGTVSAELVPATFDATHGFTDWLMLGNGPDPTLTINNGQPVGDCFFAGIFHGLMAKALVQAANGVWIPQAPQFTTPTANQVVGLYLGYQNGLAPGQTATTGPDNGTEPTAGFQWFQKAGIIKRWAPISVDQLNQGVFEHKGVLTAWALDEDAETEFAEGKPWTEHSVAVDPIEGGHATYRAAYRPGYGIELTWGAEEPATDQWEKHHIQGAYWFQAPWEPDPVGYDFGPLDAKLTTF